MLCTKLIICSNYYFVLATKIYAKIAYVNCNFHAGYEWLARKPKDIWKIL